ncbi:hypothetical protein HY213_03405 [Candidatus Peregrinibacteria bacterium]|nr:hypothetical protein [Candidatus Peregrinibacteria bacterium]
MQEVRIEPIDETAQKLPCRCGKPGHGWDRIEDVVCCPECEEQLAVGEAEPLTLRTRRRDDCVACGKSGSICLRTAYPPKEK